MFNLKILNKNSAAKNKFDKKNKLYFYEFKYFKTKFKKRKNKKLITIIKWKEEWNKASFKSRINFNIMFFINSTILYQI